MAKDSLFMCVEVKLPKINTDKESLIEGVWYWVAGRPRRFLGLVGNRSFQWSGDVQTTHISVYGPIPDPESEA